MYSEQAISTSSGCRAAGRGELKGKLAGSHTVKTPSTGSAAVQEESESELTVGEKRVARRGCLLFVVFGCFDRRSRRAAKSEMREGYQ